MLYQRGQLTYFFYIIAICTLEAPPTDTPLPHVTVIIQSCHERLLRSDTKINAGWGIAIAGREIP